MFDDDGYKNKEADSYQIEDGDKDVTNKDIDKKKNVKVTYIIVILALVFGIVVFILTNFLFNIGKKDIKEDQTLSLNNNQVVDLYKMVTKGADGSRLEKFLTVQKLKAENFSNFEKMSLALQFINEGDFKKTTKTETEYDLPVYQIPENKVDTYLKKYFGANIKYSKEGTFSFNLPFSINKLGNYISLEYNEERNSYITMIGNVGEIVPPYRLIAPYYTKLDSAVKKANGNIIIKEKVIYTEIEQLQDTNGNYINQYNYRIYKDYSHSQLLDKKEDVTKEEILSAPVNIDSYLPRANTITYTFKQNEDGKYYFYSSVIGE